LMIDLDRGSASEIHGDDDFARWAKNNRGNLLQSFNDRDRQGGLDAHWPKAGEALDNLIGGERVNYRGYNSPVSDMSIPVRETFNYTRSWGSDYQLKYGNLTAGTDAKEGAGIASRYQAVNAKNAAWADRTEVFGSAQQNWKSAKESWGKTFGYIPVVGNAGNVVFGIHDSRHGMTAKHRIGGNVAAAISGLQLVHDVVPGAAELTLGKSPSVLRFSKSYDSGWKYDPKTSEFAFTQPERVKPQSPRLQGTGMSSSPSGTSQSGSAHLNQGIAAGGTELKPEEALLRQQELQQLVKEKYSPPYPAMPAVRTQEQSVELRTRIENGSGLKGGGNRTSHNNGSSDTASFKSLQDLLDKTAKIQKIKPFSVDYMLKHDDPIPPKVYRGHRDPASSPELVEQHGLQTARGGPDDYLAAIVQHTSRSSGSAGQVLSLSANKSVALRFANEKYPVYEIDTTQSPSAFRTVTDILVNDGMRLVEEGKITQATLANAIQVSQGTTEREIFYVPGDIPPTLVTAVSARGSGYAARPLKRSS
ncbi:hypothetical protein PQR02_20585, partial [Paraburkholderia sediminicola]